MATHMWTNFRTFEHNQPVDALWLRVEELLPTNQVIKIEASGSWSCFGANVPACGPQGYLNLSVSSDQLILPESVPGALIGKIGGSDAGRKDGTIFAIGRYCTVAPLKDRGPLFVAVNGAWRLGAYTFTQLRIDIYTIDP